MSCKGESFDETPSVSESSLFLGTSEPDIRGTIKKLYFDENDSLVIAIYVEDETNGNFLYDKAVIGIREETNIYTQIDNRVMNNVPNDLEDGQIVEVLFKAGTIKEKHPISVRATEILILEAGE